MNQIYPNEFEKQQVLHFSEQFLLNLFFCGMKNQQRSECVRHRIYPNIVLDNVWRLTRQIFLRKPLFVNVSKVIRIATPLEGRNLVAPSPLPSHLGFGVAQRGEPLAC